MLSKSDSSPFKRISALKSKKNQKNQIGHLFKKCSASKHPLAPGSWGIFPQILALLLPSSGVATGGLGVRTPLCDKNDVKFSYIYTNTTKLVLHLSYLVRLD